MNDDNCINVWLHHNELRWRVVLSTPIFAATIMVGWYSLQKAGFDWQADTILIVGIVAMLFYFILISRLGDYSGAYYDAILVKPQVRKPVFRLPAKLMAAFLPLLLIAVFTTLIFVDLSAEDNSQKMEECRCSLKS